jgi:hypothetical protein
MNESAKKAFTFLGASFGIWLFFSALAAALPVLLIGWFLFTILTPAPVKNEPAPQETASVQAPLAPLSSASTPEDEKPTEFIVPPSNEPKFVGKVRLNAGNDSGAASPSEQMLLMQGAQLISNVPICGVVSIAWVPTEKTKVLDEPEFAYSCENSGQYGHAWHIPKQKVTDAVKNGSNIIPVPVDQI